MKLLLRRLAPRAWWSAQQRLRAWARLVRYPRRWVRRHYGDAALWVRIADPVAADWYDRDWAEPVEIAALRGPGLGPGARVFDLGAHQGVVAMLLALAVGPDGLVVAVEPNAHNARIARANWRRNGLTWLRLERAVAAERPGRARFFDGLNSKVADGREGWAEVELPAVSIDGLTARYGPPGVLYVDVEGYELAVLRGGGETLARHHPACFVEVHGDFLPQYGGSAAAVVHELARHGYALSACTEPDGGRFEPLDPEHAPRGRWYLLAAPSA